MATYPLKRGDSFVLNTTIYNNGPNLPPNTVPQNITGWRVIFTAKLYYSDPDSVAVSQLDNQLLGGVTIVSALGGQVLVKMPSTATLNFPDAEVDIVYDIKTVDTSTPPIVQTAESGTIQVTPSVTKAV